MYQPTKFELWWWRYITRPIINPIKYDMFRMFLQKQFLPTFQDMFEVALMDYCLSEWRKLKDTTDIHEKGIVLALPETFKQFVNSSILEKDGSYITSFGRIIFKWL